MVKWSRAGRDDAFSRPRQDPAAAERRTGLKPDKLDRRIVIGFTLILWLFTAWLLYPLIVLDWVDMSNAKPFLYRSVLGLTMLIIFFGKSLFDLIYPWVVGRKLPVMNSIFLTLYVLALTGGLVFMIIRLALLLLKNRQGGGGGFIF
jgi:hypothetical protein